MEFAAMNGNGLLHVEGHRHNETKNICGFKHEVTLESLPDIELGLIFNYLHWRDKVSLVQAVPGVCRVMNSPRGWLLFQAGERRSVENQKEELACVHTYGHLFQHCTLWLGRPCRNAWECTCLFDHLDTNNVFPVLGALVDTCQAMRSLRLYHPSHVTPLSCDTQIFKQYQQAIQHLLLYAVQRNQFILELCGLQCFHDHIRPISLRFFDYYISNPEMLQLVRVLDITRMTDSRVNHAPTTPPLKCLESMESLTTLKVPIHCVDLSVVQTLVHNCLKDLYLLSDDCTVDHDFVEHDHLPWDKLVLPDSRTLRIHYIFKQCVLYASQLTFNPYVKSVSLDSLCKPVTEDLLEAVADRYGKSLQLFAIIHSMWKPDLHLRDLSAFAAKCGHLTHFLSTMQLAGPLLLTLVENAPHLQNVLVIGQEVDSLSDIAPALSQRLGYEWLPHATPKTFHVDICELSFLIDEYVMRGYS